MSSQSGTNGPAVPGYPSYGPQPGSWPAAGSLDDTGPIPRQSPAPAGRPGAGSRQAADLARVLGLIVAALGALNFIWGFLPELTAARSQDSLSVFAVGPAYVPVLLLIGGLLALAALLPGDEVSRLAVAAVSVGGAAGAIVSLGTQGAVQLVSTSQVSKGMGAILLVIFGIIQAVVAIGAYVVGADGSPWARRRPVPVTGPQAVGGGSGPGHRSGAGTAAAFAGPGAGSAGPGAGSAGPGGFGVAAQPGWYGPPGGWPPVDPRNTPPDERPTGPQHIVTGGENGTHEAAVMHARRDPSTGPSVPVETDEDGDKKAGESSDDHRGENQA